MGGAVLFSFTSLGSENRQMQNVLTIDRSPACWCLVGEEAPYCKSDCDLSACTTNYKTL